MIFYTICFSSSFFDFFLQWLVSKQTERICVKKGILWFFCYQDEWVFVFSFQFRAKNVPTNQLVAVFSDLHTVWMLGKATLTHSHVNTSTWKANEIEVWWNDIQFFPFLPRCESVWGETNSLVAERNLAVKIVCPIYLWKDLNWKSNKWLSHPKDFVFF